MDAAEAFLGECPGPVVVLGAGGQLGREFVRLLGRQAVACSRSDLDLTQPSALRELLERHAPALVINCAAYNLVDKAETDPVAAFAVNTLAVRELARACAERQVPLVHFSTDHVFGLDASRRTPCSEADLPGPVSTYGTSKYAGELCVRASCRQSWVIRTCGLYAEGPIVGKGNFVDTMLRLARERPELKVVNDQTCTPTAVRDLARATLALVRTGRHGLYHVTNFGACTWFEFASRIMELAGLTPRMIPITSREFGAPAARPAYSVLNCDQFAETVGWTMPSWQDALAQAIAARQQETDKGP